MKKIIFATITTVCLFASAYYCSGNRPPWRFDKKAPLKKADTIKAVAKPTVKSSTEVYTEALNDSALCFPLKHDNIYSLYSYVIDLRDERIIARYKPIFDAHNYEFSGYVWQGILKQILSKAGGDIAKNTFLVAQDDLVMFTITRYPVKKELPEFICPILSSPGTFASYIRKADRNFINNY